MVGPAVTLRTCASSAWSGHVHSSSRPRPWPRCCAPATKRSSSTRAALRRGDGRHVLRRAGPAEAGPCARHRQRIARAADGGDADRSRPDRRGRAAGRRPGLWRYEFDAGGSPGRGQARRPGGPCRGRPSLVRPADARGGQSGRRRPPVALALRPDAGRCRQPRGRRHRRRGRAGRRPHAGPGGPDRAAGPRPRRAARPSRFGAWTSRRVATCSRRSIAQRTGRRRRSGRGSDSLDRSPARTGPSSSPSIRGPVRRSRHRAPTSESDVLVIEPLGYRSSLTLQLHAAAVLTDSGGVQREASWLGVPCLVLRSTTEWPELLVASGGRMSLVALDARRAPRSFGGGRRPEGARHWPLTGPEISPSGMPVRRRDHGPACLRRGRPLGPSGEDGACEHLDEGVDIRKY